jgi:hypothetical protein
MSKAATPGFCPYCKTALNSGAAACAGCGAFETTRWGEWGAWRYSLLGFCFVVGPLLALFFLIFSPKAALVVLVGSFAIYFLIRFRLKRKIVWAVGGRRVI